MPLADGSFCSLLSCRVSALRPGYFFGDGGILAEFIAVSVVLQKFSELWFGNAENFVFQAAEGGLATDRKAGVIGSVAVPVEAGTEV